MVTVGIIHFCCPSLGNHLSSSWSILEIIFWLLVNFLEDLIPKKVILDDSSIALSVLEILSVKNVLKVSCSLVNVLRKSFSTRQYNFQCYDKRSANTVYLLCYPAYWSGHWKVHCSRLRSLHKAAKVLSSGKYMN